MKNSINVNIKGITKINNNRVLNTLKIKNPNPKKIAKKIGSSNARSIYGAVFS